ncbi:methyl-accepting chemotaxis protein [Herbaspirillum sp. GCM10030257]|uniref:methyl-accepting chemotaxis protein n=1 Tax=Herbaspirillum sp. GCM10030257 TaxID=3273393 RepID=UPI003613A0B7
MKVGTKLILGFLCIAILGAVVAVIGIYSMGRMNDKAAEMYHNELLGLSYIKDANINLIYAGRARGNVLLSMTAEERDLNTANIKKYLGQVNDNLDKAKPLFVTERAKQIFAQYAQASENYEKEMAKALALASKESLQSYSEELKKELETTRHYANTLDNLLAELAKQKEARAKTASEETSTLYESSFALMSALVLCSLAAGIALGLLVTRNLTRQLGGEPHYAAEIAAKVAAGDLSVDVQTKAGDQSSLLYAMKKMRESLSTVVAQVRAGTDTIASASTQIASGNQDLSSRTEQQASSLEETASSMEELTSTVKQNADNARQANSLAEAASGVAAKGGEVILQVVGTMHEINDSAAKIVDIIGVIDGIAFQTNILALNAAVEAARAGEQGRGFAVVASEVRNLAQRSAAAAKEIKSLIGDSVEKVENGSKLVNEAGSTMTEIVDSVKRVTDIMAEITAASQEQTAGIEQINLAINQMDEVTQQNAALVEEAAAAAAAMQEQAGKLSEVVSVFKIESMQQLPDQFGKAQLTTSQRVVPAVPRVKKEAVVSHSAKPAISSPRRVAMTSAKDDWEEF